MSKATAIVVLTGAGISAESGLRTFRDSDGLWEGYNVEDVATPRAWQANPELVLDFYNQRRRDVAAAKPNRAHIILAELGRRLMMSASSRKTSTTCTSAAEAQMCCTCTAKSSRCAPTGSRMTIVSL